MAKRPRKLQEIFNVVIQAKYYNSDTSPHAERQYMCVSLAKACRDTLVTPAERDRATAAIQDYMAKVPGNWGTLQNALKWGGADNSREAQLNVYRNWVHRPKLDPKFKPTVNG